MGYSVVKLQPRRAKPAKSVPRPARKVVAHRPRLDGLPLDLRIVLRYWPRVRNVRRWPVPLRPVAAAVVFFWKLDESWVWVRLHLQPKVWSFFQAHAGGLAPTRVQRARRAVCNRCEHQRITPIGEYCSARGCGCPAKWWWPFSRLGWLRRLGDVWCSIGKW